MGGYDYLLGQAFPFTFEASREKIEELAKYLMAPERHFNGSSFAVTSDCKTGNRRLFLSNTSYNWLLDAELM